MCGRLVEAISGVPFADYMRKVIFEPLGMDSTSFTLDAETEAPQLCTLCAPVLHGTPVRPDVIAVRGLRMSVTAACCDLSQTTRSST